MTVDNVIPPDFFVSQGAPEETHVVLTSGFKIARNRVDIDLQSKRGNIRLIVGERGIGKSTCLQFLDSHVKDQVGAGRSIIFDSGICIPFLLQVPDTDKRIALLLSELAKRISNGKFDSISSLIDFVNTRSGGPFFVFVDNLDRFYRAEDDRQFINAFFRSADPVLKALTKNIVLVFSCAPEWEVFLRTEDLSYLNYSNRIDLDPLTEGEVTELLTQRSTAMGLDPRRIFTPDLVPALALASRGNARSVFQFLERVARDPAASEGPIDAATFQRVLRTEMFDAAIEGLRNLASRSSKASWGVNQLWRFFDTLQKTGVDALNGIRFLDLGCTVTTIPKSEADSVGPAWRKVGHRVGGDIALNPQVRTIIVDWSRLAGISREILLTAFSERPFSTSTTDIEDYADEFREALQIDTNAAADFEMCLELYLRLTARKADEWDRKELVQQGWQCVGRLMLAIASISSPRISAALRTELNSKESAQTAFSTLISRIDELYRAGRRANALRADLVSVLQRYRDLEDNPTVATYWDGQQLVEFRRQVLGAVEGIIRTLRPNRIISEGFKSAESIVQEALRADESKQLEFKSSLRWDYKQDKPNGELEWVVMRAIAGLLNAEGGRLLIGVGSDKAVIGLGRDYGTLKDKNRDGFERCVIDKASGTLGPAVTTQLDLKFVQIEGNDIALVSVPRYPEPVYLRRDGKPEFWVRTGNSTRQLDVAETQKYIQSHWKKGSIDIDP